MIKKERVVVFINPKIERQFKSLESGKYEDKKLFTYIKRAIEDLKENPGSGIKISKDIWPEKYVKEYKIDNLWKYDLPKGWRLIYTLISSEVRIFNVLLEWFDHKSYEKRFGYN